MSGKVKLFTLDQEVKVAIPVNMQEDDDANDKAITICKTVRTKTTRSTPYKRPHHRVVSTLDKKLDIIRRVEAGQTKTEVSRALELPRQTVANICRNAERIKASCQHSSNIGAKTITRMRSSTIEKMEKMLSLWIEDNHQNRIPVNVDMIMQKARSLFDHLKETGSVETFVASKGWFDRFKKREKIHKVSVEDGVQTFVSASVDVQAAEMFSQVLKTTIESGDYPPCLVFNVKEAGLFWKKMPSKTFLAQEENRVASAAAGKDRFSLLLGGNATGDLKLKPMLVYHSETPSAMKGYSKPALPVTWKSNKKAQVTKSLFAEWFTDYFCPMVQSYCLKKELEPKALLLLDTGPSHPSKLGELQTCIPVKVMFLPLSTTSILQPMDQGVIAIFKARYLRRIMQQVLEANDGQQQSIKAFWLEYNIMKAISNIKFAWTEVRGHCLNAAWKPLWPEIVKEKDWCLKSTMKSEIEDIAKLAQDAGFESVDAVNVKQLLDSHKEEPLTNKEIEALMNWDPQQEAVEEEEEAVVAAAPVAKVLTRKILTENLSQISRAVELLVANDPDVDRGCRFRREVSQALKGYTLMLEETKRYQTQIDSYFMKSRESKPGTSASAKRY